MCLCVCVCVHTHVYYGVYLRLGLLNYLPRAGFEPQSSWSLPPWVARIYSTWLTCCFLNLLFYHSVFIVKCLLQREMLKTTLSNLSNVFFNLFPLSLHIPRYSVTLQYSFCGCGGRVGGAGVWTQGLALPLEPCL
jgi:hypothetical protein